MFELYTRQCFHCGNHIRSIDGQHYHCYFCETHPEYKSKALGPDPFSQAWLRIVDQHIKDQRGIK